MIVGRGRGKGNPYHDAAGKFCSEAQMIGEIRAALNSGNADLYFTMRKDYEDIKRTNQPDVSPELISELLSGKRELTEDEELDSYSVAQLYEKISDNWAGKSEEERKMLLEKFLYSANASDTFTLLCNKNIELTPKETDDIVWKMVANARSRTDANYLGGTTLAGHYDFNAADLPLEAKYRMLVRGEEHVGYAVARDATIPIEKRFVFLDSMSAVNADRMLSEMTADELQRKDIQDAISEIEFATNSYYKQNNRADLDKSDRTSTFLRYSNDATMQSEIVETLDASRSKPSVIRGSGDDYRYRRAVATLVENPFADREILQKHLANLVNEFDPNAPRIYPPTLDSKRNVSPAVQKLAKAEVLLGDESVKRAVFLNAALPSLINYAEGYASRRKTVEDTISGMLETAKFDNPNFPDVKGVKAALTQYDKIVNEKSFAGEKLPNSLKDTLLQIDSTPEGFKALVKKAHKAETDKKDYGTSVYLTQRILSVVNRLTIQDWLDAVKEN